MKKTFLKTLVLSPALLLFLAFNPHTEDGTIKGGVSPADGATAVWAISGTDSVKTDIKNGVFMTKGLKEGAYTVIVDATDAYEDAKVENVQVSPDNATDLGEIVLKTK